jgi:hypothetical protein
MTAMLTENERDMKIAESTGLLDIKRAEYSRNVELALIDAEKACDLP